VAGHVNWDVTLRVDRLPEPDDESRITAQHASGGGSAANVAYDLAVLGVDAGVLGSVGEDPLERVPDGETTVKYLLVEETGEVAVLGNDGANEAIGPDDVDPGLVDGVAHVHLTSQRPDTAARVAELASAAGATVSVDPGRRLADRDYDAVLAAADLVFVNDREAEAVLEEPPKAAFPEQTLVVKHGAAGAEVHAPEGHFEHPGFGVDPVDTTGAGDAFAAAFVATRLDGGDYATTLERANAAGASAASTNGAREAPDAAELDAFVAERT